MGPLRGVLLAVVLLEVVLGDEGGDCRGQRAADCEVTEVEGLLATLLCGEKSNHHGGRPRANLTARSAIKINLETDNTLNDNYLSNNTHTVDYSESHYNITFGDVNHAISRENLNNSNIYIYQPNNTNYQNKTEALNVDKVLGKTSKIDNSIKNPDWPPFWSRVTTIKINLNSSIILLDLSSFINVNTVIINTFNYTLSRTCATSNVSSLSITSSLLSKVPFVDNLSGLKQLNLSHNSISKIPIQELPIAVESLDLSSNNIGFNGTVYLPTALTVLNVSYNDISNNFILRGNLSILVMKGNKLTYIPDLDMASLEELIVAENNISVLKTGVFKKIPALTLLDIRNNALKILEEKAFEGLSKLQLLDISENNIMSLAPATFQYLSNLVSLTLSKNTNLGSFQHGKDASLLFGTSQRLQIIIASKTNLTRIPSTLTRSVRKLCLAENNIDSIQCGELDSFPLLQTMDLSRNKISEIEEDAFGRLDFLSNLILTNNRLTIIPKSLPDQLKVLDLRCNIVEKLSHLDFLGMQKLEVLLLSRNKIDLIEDGSFGQLSSLEVLDLSYNPIKFLSRTSFIGPRRLKEIYLVSLKDLIPLQEPLSFPAPESAHLEVLNIESSPVLATQLMDDIAALTMFHELFELNLNHCRLSTLRSDLPKYLPRLHKLELTGNALNCSNIIWLVKWLQALNISMQDTGRFRQEIYNLKDICCQEGDITTSIEKTKLICASPEFLSGKEIISLEQELIPDFKLTSSTQPSAAKRSFSTEHYLQDFFSNTNYDTTPRVLPTDTVDSVFIEYFSTRKPVDLTTKLENWISSDGTSPRTLTTLLTSDSEKGKTSANAYTLGKQHLKLSKLLKTEKSFNQESHKWKYLKSDNQHKYNFEPLVAHFNETKTSTKDFDSHLNDSISLGAFLSHDPPPTSHPGMIVFVCMCVCGLLLAAAAMLYSQCSQSYRSQHYKHQQDIEVTTLGGCGNELW